MNGKSAIGHLVGRQLWWSQLYFKSTQRVIPMLFNLFVREEAQNKNRDGEIRSKVRIDNQTKNEA